PAVPDQRVHTCGGGPRSLEWRRGGSTLDRKVPGGGGTNDNGGLESLIGGQQAIRPLGVVALDLNPSVAALLPSVRRQKGAVVARITPDSPYSQQGRLQPGDVIYSINGQIVRSADDLKLFAGQLKPSAATVLLIERESTMMYFAFRVDKP